MVDRGSKWSGLRATANRSEEHTSELQSLRHLVCRLLLEKKTVALVRTARVESAPMIAALPAPSSVIPFLPKVIGTRSGQGPQPRRVRPASAPPEPVRDAP